MPTPDATTQALQGPVADSRGEPGKTESRGEAGNTQSLGEAGKTESLGALFTRLQAELRSIVRRERRQSHVGDTYSTTVVINELYLKLAGNENLSIADDRHFYATACTAIRYLLVDVARARLRQKRGAGAETVALQDCYDLAATEEHQAVLLSTALSTLESEKPRQAQVVNLRYFGGLADVEIGRLLEIDESTVRRDWQKARARMFELVHEV